MSTPLQASLNDEFHIDSQLLSKCTLLLQKQGISYLLHNNAEVIWFILVPHTHAEEFYQLPPEQLQLLCAEINRISRNIETCFTCDRLLVTTIGNEIEQMHVHIVCSGKKDRFLPEKMWDQPIDLTHSQVATRELARLIENGVP